MTLTSPRNGLRALLLTATTLLLAAVPLGAQTAEELIQQGEVLDLKLRASEALAVYQQAEKLDLARSIGTSKSRIFRHLQTLVAQALQNNRDLRIAAANIAAARAQVRITRANQLPRLDSAAGVEVTPRRNEDGDREDFRLGHALQHGRQHGADRSRGAGRRFYRSPRDR